MKPSDGPRGIWCVVPAAGSCRRAGGGVPKQYRPLLGKPMLLRTMERFPCALHRIFLLRYPIHLMLQEKLRYLLPSPRW